MRVLLAGIFILFCNYGKIVESGPLGSLQFGSSGIQLGSLQHHQFTESIVDWLRDMKTRIFDSPSAIPNIMSIIDSTKDSYERQKKSLERLIIDMSFDPDKDWGLRVGNWYLIRKDSDDVMLSFWHLVHPRAPAESTTNDGWPEFNFDNDKTNDPPSFNTIIPIVPTTIEEKIPQSTESLDSKDNETVDASAEVISPNNSK